MNNNRYNDPNSNNPVSLILAEKQTQTELEGIVLTSILNYRKPVLTKFLAKKLKMERTDLVIVLNSLQKKGFVSWKTTKPKDDDLVCGWIKCS